MLLFLLLACAPEPRDGTRVCVAPPAPQPADLDADGWPDLVFAQTEDAQGSYVAESLVYWGAAEGFSAEHRTSLPTVGADDVAIADFAGDGYPDLVFASVGDGERRDVDSLLYPNGAEGFDVAGVRGLPGLDAAAVNVLDADGDGRLDVFLANRYSGDGFSLESYTVDSVLYPGADPWPDAAAGRYVQTVGAGDARFAHLDGDGVLDLVVASGTFLTATSRVYWGTVEGWDATRVTELPTAAPEGVEVADWNSDGWLDLFFSNFYEDFVLDIDSFLYWGGPAGYDAGRVTAIPTHGATDALAVDLDGDNCAELVVANAMTGDFAELDFTVDLDIWAGDLDGSLTLATSLPASSAAALSAADLDLDGDVDLVVANRYDAEGAPVTDSFVYWNEGGALPEAFSADVVTALPTVGAAGVSARLE